MKRQTTLDLQKKKNRNEKIVALTAYDATFARALDGRVDLILVGDSVGTVIQGDEDTLNVTIEDMVYHTRCVSRQIKTSHLVSDMPFLSYQINDDEAVKNAGKLLQAGAQSVKLEGGESIAPLVKRLTSIGIPVLGHIGMTPQSVHMFGGYKVQGKHEGKKDQLLRDAKIVEESGAYALVLESVPADLATLITQHAKIPTIGIGAGAECDGQILVCYDLLGMDPTFKPKFLKRYANLFETVQNSVKKYAEEVKGGVFPSKEQTYT